MNTGTTLPTLTFIGLEASGGSVYGGCSGAWPPHFVVEEVKLKLFVFVMHYITI